MGILVQWMQYEYPSSPMFRSCNGDLNCVIPGLYAMVGAAATLSGVTVSLLLDSVTVQSGTERVGNSALQFH